MKNLVPAFVQNVPCVRLRSLEAECEFRKNAVAALAIAVALHATVIASYFLLPAEKAAEVKKGNTRVLTPWTPIDIEHGWKTPAGGKSSAKAGIPIPVPIVESEKDEPQYDSPVGTGWTDGIPGPGGNIGDEPVVGFGNPPIDMPEDNQPVELHRVEREPVLVKRVTPKYPELLLKAEVTGRVTLKLWVDKEGKVREVHVLQSDNEMFNEAAIGAAKQFLFTPAYMNAGPVSVWVSVPFTFRLAHSERTK